MPPNRRAFRHLDDTVRLMCSGKAFSMLTYWWMLPQLDNATACPAVAVNSR
jgi:hypothetical protein